MIQPDIKWYTVNYRFCVFGRCQQNLFFFSFLFRSVRMTTFFMAGFLICIKRKFSQYLAERKKSPLIPRAIYVERYRVISIHICNHTVINYFCTYRINKYLLTWLLSYNLLCNNVFVLLVVAIAHQGLLHLVTLSRVNHMVIKGRSKSGYAVRRWCKIAALYIA